MGYSFYGPISYPDFPTSTFLPWRSCENVEKNSKLLLSFSFYFCTLFFLGKLFFFNLRTSFSQKKRKRKKLILFLLNLIKGKKFIIHSSTTSLSTAAWKCQVHQASSQLWNSMSRYIYCRSSWNSANWIWSANSHFILHRLRLFLKCPWSWSP